MKKTILIGLCALFIASCSFVNDLGNHCTIYKSDADVKTGSFDVCAKCDSLADVVKAQTAKIEAKKAK